MNLYLSPEAIAFLCFVALVFLLVISMGCYELAKYGLFTEVIDRKRYTSTNLTTLVFVVIIGTWAFTYAVAFAYALVRDAGQ